MSIPVVTCGPNQSKNYSASAQSINLTVSATGSPSVYTWTMKDVPPGSTANVGVNGDFTNGVSIDQNPTFLTTGGVDGAYVCECIVTNIDGDSDPEVDRDTCQTIVYILTEIGSKKLPGDYQFSYGDDLNQTIRDLIVEIYGEKSITLLSGATRTTYNTIAAAFSASVANDSVMLGPGTFLESSLVVPVDVKIFSMAGKEVTIIAGDGSANDVFILSTGSSIHGLDIRMPTSANYAINANPSTSSILEEVRIVGQGGVGKGIVKSTPGALSIQRYIFLGDCDKCIEVSDGVVITHNGNILSGTINCGIEVTGGRFTGTSIGLTSPDLAEGFCLGGNGVARINSLEARDVTRCIHMTSDTAKATFISVTMDETIDEQILVDPGLNNCVLEISAAQMNFNKIVYPKTNPFISLYYLDNREADQALQVEAEVVIGRQGRGREITGGEGDSTTVGMVVLQNTNLEIGTWSDVTTIAASPTGSTVDVFPVNTAGACFYIGATWNFPGVKLLMDTAIILGAGSFVTEYYNGAWVPLNIMSADSDPPFNQYGNTSLDKVGSYHSRYGDVSDMTLKTLDGNNRNWVRARLVSPITQSSKIQQVKVHVNRFEGAIDGTIEFFGSARPPRSIPALHRKSLEDTGSSPTNDTVLVSSNITIVGVDNYYVDNQRKARGGIFAIPFGLDTSWPITLELTWIADNNVGNVEWELIYTRLEPGHLFNGASSDITISKIVAVPGVSLTEVITEIELDVTSYLIGDSIGISVVRDARPSNSDDTLSGNVTLINIAGNGIFWM